MIDASERSREELTDEERAEWHKVLKGTRLTAGNGVWSVPPVSVKASSTSQSEALCGVKRFEYPKCWTPYSDRRGVGFMFRAELEFKPHKPDNSYYCECCVFRQLLHRGHVHQENDDSAPRDFSDPNKEYRLDNKVATENPSDKRYTFKKGETIMYGGKRADGSKRGSPDTPGSEAGLWSGECEFCMVDRPRTPYARDPGSHELTYDFVGLVFDRCRSWLLVAAKRFVLHRKFTIKPKKGGGLRRVLKGGYPKLTRGVPPGSGRARPEGEPMTTAHTCKDC